jgi:hypothetical protein
VQTYDITKVTWIRSAIYVTTPWKTRADLNLRVLEANVAEARPSGDFSLGTGAVGKHRRWGLNLRKNQNPWLTIIGVIADITDGPLAPEPCIHASEPFSKLPDVVLNDIPFGRQFKLAVRIDVDPHSLVSAYARRSGAIDRQLAIDRHNVRVNGTAEAKRAAPKRYNLCV